MGKVWVGTSGYNYRDWQGDFYPKDLPQDKWLEFYSTNFKTVEINASFYGSFKQRTYQKWANLTPKDFRFAIKGPRFITHVLRLKTEDLRLKNGIKKFFGAARGLKDKLRVVLWQFPSNFQNKEENVLRLNNFLRQLPKDSSGLPAGRQVFEFRHKSWLDRKIYRLLNQAKAGFVISESSVFPSEEVVAGGVCYIRFHGPTALYSSPYSTKQLKDWAVKIRSWAKSNDVYCYFNNDAGGHAFRNAAELSTILRV